MAKEHLLNYTLSVGKVSELAGFRTQGHFAKVFRRIVGATPSDFREQSWIEERGRVDQDTQPGLDRGKKISALGR